ncbi:MAG: hypothetical protein ABSD73_09445 [Candidatus Bathyarchaeia archaeon]
MKNRKLKMSVLLIATLIVAVGIYGIWANVGPKSTGLAGDNSGFSLVRPAFAQSMAAATTFLDQEAGISIYLNTGSSMDVNAAAANLVNIENKTSDWAIGSVPLSSPFTSSDYPHCFVHKSGWIVVYYLKATSQNMAYISKMIVWKSVANVNSPLNDTKLEQGLRIACTPLGISTTNAQYYDFQYPSATNLLIAAKTTINGSPATFNIEIPGTMTVYEQAWCHKTHSWTSWGNPVSPSAFKIDQTQVDSWIGSDEVTIGMLAFLPTNPLALDMFHVVYVDGDTGYCGICLTILYS